MTRFLQLLKKRKPKDKAKPCLLNHIQSEALLSPSSPCCCQSQTRRCDITTPMLDKVTRTEIVAHAGFAWFMRTFTALCFVSEVVVGAGALVGQVVYQGLVRRNFVT